jgi:putative membrane protein
MLYNHAIRWRLRQRLSTCERELTELRTPRPEPVVATPVDLSVSPSTTTPPIVQPSVAPGIGQ